MDVNADQPSTSTEEGITAVLILGGIGAIRAEGWAGTAVLGAGAMLALILLGIAMCESGARSGSLDADRPDLVADEVQGLDGLAAVGPGHLFP